VWKFFTRSTILAVVAIAAMGMVWAQDDPRIGTWALNIAKSNILPDLLLHGKCGRTRR